VTGIIIERRKCNAYRRYQSGIKARMGWHTSRRPERRIWKLPMPGDSCEELYKDHAAACLEIARKTDDRAGKLALLDLARAWIALAEEHDKNHRAALA
jgi:hypothetical protein